MTVTSVPLLDLAAQFETIRDEATEAPPTQTGGQTSSAL